ENIDGGVARHGHLLASNKPNQYEGLEEEVELMEREVHHKLRLIPLEQQGTEIGSDLYFGALLDECSGGLNPAQYVTGLAGAAEKAGASLHAGARVMGLKRQGSHFLVETERGRLSAEQVLVGTSGYTGSATKKLQTKIIPIGSFII